MPKNIELAINHLFDVSSKFKYCYIMNIFYVWLYVFFFKYERKNLNLNDKQQGLFPGNIVP